MDAGCFRRSRAFGIWQGLFGDPLTGFALPDGRITSTIGNPVMLGACLVVLCPLALDETLRKQTLFAAASLSLIIAALVMTWSRGAWLSAAAAVSIYLWSTGRLRFSRRRALSALVAASLFLFALQRVLRKGNSDSLRLETAKSALTAFEARPLLGFGPDTFVILFRRYKTEEFLRLAHQANIGQFSAHNDLLQAAVTLGIFGLFAYGWLMWVLGARLFARLSGPAPDARAAAIAAALIGLFIQAKFNPIPISALALAAIMAGLVCRGPRNASARGGRAAAALAAALCAATAFVYGRFCAANHLFLRGERSIAANALAGPAYMAGVNDLRRANELNPWLIDYLAARVDVIFNVSEAAPPEQRRQLIDKALELTAEGLRLHPGNPTAHEMRATALAMSARTGSKRLPEALAEIKTASELDPTFTFTLRRRMDIDRALGDDADFQRTRARYLKVIRLTGESPGWNSPNF